MPIQTKKKVAKRNIESKSNEKEYKAKKVKTDFAVNESLAEKYEKLTEEHRCLLIENKKCIETIKDLRCKLTDIENEEVKNYTRETQTEYDEGEVEIPCKN